jgi:DNA-binding MarR family transcriptional regulator
MKHADTSGITQDVASLDTFENYESSSAQERVLQVQVCIAAHGPIKLAELARMLSLPKSSISRIVALLLRVGWLFRNPVDHTYMLTSDFAKLADQSDTPQSVHDRIRSVIEETCKNFALSYSLQEIRVANLHMTEVARADADGSVADVLVHPDGILAAFFALPTDAAGEATAQRFLKTLSSLHNVSTLRRKLMLALLRNGEVHNERHSAVSIGLAPVSGPPMILWMFASEQNSEVAFGDAVAQIRDELAQSKTGQPKAILANGISPKHGAFLKAILHQAATGDIR